MEKAERFILVTFSKAGSRGPFGEIVSYYHRGFMGKKRKDLKYWGDYVFPLSRR